MEDVTGLEVRMAPTDSPGTAPWLSTFGTFDGGGEHLMNQAWPKLKQVFAIRRQSDRDNGSNTTTTNPRVFYNVPNFPARTLTHHPVDLLVVERSSVAKCPSVTYVNPWETAVKNTKSALRPIVILESWNSECSTWQYGPTTQAVITRWKELGYATRIKFVQCASVGGALCQSRILVARVLQPQVHRWFWPNIPANPPLRPMSNLLTPPGLVRCRYIRRPLNDPCIASAHSDPMPSRPGALIETDKGIRPLQTDEFCRGLGFLKSNIERIDGGLARRVTSVYHWEYLSSVLSGTPPDIVPHPAAPSFPLIDLIAPFAPSTEPTPPSFAFEWKPKDLSIGGEWYNQRVKNLRQACSFYPNASVLFADGLHRLTTHRSNYDHDGPNPTFLQLLWWEFPAEHWNELRDGFKMNFLKPPSATLVDNAEMTDSELAAATEFVDELVSLGVLRQAEEGMKILSNAPLFVVPKPGQPGQWRCIADMKAGGQNACIGADPCFLPRTRHILDEMYVGGFSAVVDLSKYFHNFPTHPDDRPYLGCIHPVTKILFTYFGLPMGSSNSPATSGRAGNSFIRKIKENFEIFAGVGKPNCYWSHFEGLGYDPDLGYGFVLTNKTGLAVKLWGFVDDFLLHGPNLKSVKQGLTIFLDFALDCGFLAHPKKLVLPSQEVKYCGFLFNSVSQPTQKIPLEKREHGLAICDHLLAQPPSFQWSRLSLAVAAGSLEHLSEATPRRYGHTVLRALHTLIHPPGAGTGIDPYYTKTCLNADVRLGLKWWRGFLYNGGGRSVRPLRAGTLSSLFGDGSGTGTGGTVWVDGAPQLQWSAVWDVVVYCYTSNYKELNTIKLALQQLKKYSDPTVIRHSTVFYFTDNSVSYYIAASGSSGNHNLHRLITEIRHLEMELGIQLVVIHIPGVVMIDQGTDGLSRGVWMSKLHSFTNEQDMLSAIFAPTSFDPSLLDLIYTAAPDLWISPDAFYYDWRLPWDAASCFNCTTIWCPPPELARQVITFLLNTWVERPYTTSALLIIPRTCSASYRGLSKFVSHVGTIYPQKTDLIKPPALPIPIEVFYIAPHSPTLPKLTPPRRFSHPDLEWHQQAAEEMRRLPPVTIGNS